MGKATKRKAHARQTKARVRGQRQDQAMSPARGEEWRECDLELLSVYELLQKQRELRQRRGAAD